MSLPSQRRSVACALLLLLVTLLAAPPCAAEGYYPESSLSVPPAGLLLLAAALSMALAAYLAIRAPKTRDPSQRTLVAWLTIGAFFVALMFVLGASSISLSSPAVGFIPMTDRGAQVLRLVVSALLLAHILLRVYLQSQGLSERWATARARALLLLAALALAGYFNWGALHFGSFVHRHELLHYFLGAKNAPELRYTRLYDCALQALREDRPDWLNMQEQRVQDLVTNQIVFAYQLDERMSSCPKHFSPERWQKFKTDVVALRGKTDSAMWNASLIDYGYNPPPTWNVLPGAIVRNLELTDGNLTLVALIDPLLVAVGLVAVTWAFGLEIACYAACTFGLIFPARFYWTGGGFMRQDWLACLLLGISLLRRSFPLSGGFFLGCSALLRIFPLCFLFGPLVLAALRLARAKAVEREPVRLLVGVLLSCAVLLPLGALSMGGSSAYREFAQNSVKHLSFPFTNNMGFPSLVSFGVAPEGSDETRQGDEFQKLETYKAIRAETFERRKPLLVAGTAGFLALFIFCLRRERRLWVLATFGFTLVPVATQISCYYYSFLMVAAFMLREEPRIVVLLVVTTFLGQVLGLALGRGELLYSSLSLLAVYFAAESVLTYRHRLQRPPG